MSERGGTIRVRLRLEGRTRDLATVNPAIDGKLGGCDRVRLKIDDVRRESPGSTDGGS